MLERLGGVWLGLGVIVGWTLVCAYFVWAAWEPEEIAADGGEALAFAGWMGFVVLVWLAIIIPTIWGIRRSTGQR